VRRVVALKRSSEELFVSIFTFDEGREKQQVVWKRRTYLPGWKR
jgi:hypothetical protein